MPEARIELSWEKSFEPVHGLEAGTRHLVSIRREIIPIFFVPGIMGTRCRRAGSLPPSGTTSRRARPSTRRATTASSTTAPKRSRPC